jgi:hypothetical protein
MKAFIAAAFVVALSPASRAIDQISLSASAAAVEALYAEDDARVAATTAALAAQDVGRIAIDVCIDPEARTLDGEATISVRGTASSRAFSLAPALTVTGVSDGGGNALRFQRSGDTLRVQAPAGAERIVVSYGGSIAPSEWAWVDDGLVVLSPRSLWYPGPAAGDRCSYRVVVRYPDGDSSVSAGTLAGMTSLEDEAPARCRLGDVWEARAPVPGVGVAVGRLTSSLSVTGRLFLGYHAPPSGEGAAAVDAAQEALTSVKDLVRYLEVCYGPYPFEWLNVIVVPAGGSSGSDVLWAPGFVAVRVPKSSGSKGPLPVGRITAALSRSFWPSWVDGGPLVSDGLAARAEVSLLAERGAGGDVPRRDQIYARYAPALADSASARLARRCAVHGAAAPRALCRARGLAFFEILEQVVGHDAFCRALTSLSTAFGGSAVAFRDVISAFEDASGLPLDWFVYEWGVRTDLPSYALDYSVSSRGHGYVVRGTIRQAGDFYRTPVPLTVDLGVWSYEEWVPIESPEQRFEFRVDAEPLAVSLDAGHLIPVADRLKTPAAP